MIIFWTLVILLALFGTLVCYSALVVASRADEWEERRLTVMTFEEFAEKMEKLTELDMERRHVEMDNLMCELLTELGYGEGVEIFEDCYKWYA